MQRAVLIIQARMGSSRLPGKSMMDLAGQPLLARIIDRVKRCQKIDEIILAVPDSTQNDPLVALGEERGVKVFRGSENNLITRYLGAAEEVSADLIVRLPADNVAPEPTEIDRIVSFHKSLGRPGFSTNLAQIRNSKYPDGIGAEVFEYSLLKDASLRSPNARQREHVHLNFYDYERDEAIDEEWCPVAAPTCPPTFARPDIVLDVNTTHQLDDMRDLYEYMMPRNPHFTIEHIIDWFDNVRAKRLKGRTANNEQ